MHQRFLRGAIVLWVGPGARVPPSTRTRIQVEAMYAASFQCAGCFEWVETTVDESGGSRQEYVEDCQVCCQPNVLTIRWDSADRQYTISAALES